MAKELRDRLHERKDRTGWYADLRFAGGSRHTAMIPEGETSATEDWDEAYDILKARVEELENAPAAEERSEPGDVRIADYMEHHLGMKKVEGDRPATVDRNRRAIRTVLRYWGEDVRLGDVTTDRVADYMARRGRKVKPQTLLHELHAMSNLFRRAVVERRAIFNPFDGDHIFKKPDPAKDRPEAVWLELGEAARLIRAAYEQDQDPHNRAFPYLGPLVATFLYTGGRAGGVTGLTVADVEFPTRPGELGHVRFAHNRYRKLKSKHAVRRVPLWPELERRLRAYIESRPDLGELLFPAEGGGPLTDVSTSRQNAVDAAKIQKRVTWHTLRHTYAATRLQTTDAGRAVSPYTVMKELGHGSLKLIEETYGHVQKRRARGEHVEYVEAEVVSIGQGRKAAR